MNPAFPTAFLERMKEQLGTEWPLFEAACGDRPQRGIRFQPEKAPELAERLSAGLDPIPWVEHARYLPADSDLGKTAAHEAGLFYLQEPSAMIPAAVLDVKPGENVLDLCAAPGGKSTQIGAAMKGKGLLVCNEIVSQRAQILSRNVERMGITNATVTNESPERLAAYWPEGFDAVLADAPCSGEGMFRRDPETAAEWLPERAAGCAERQKSILHSAAALVRPGGRLVYSTCTFHPEENEGVVRWFLRAHPEFTAVPFRIAGQTCDRGWETFYPHRIRGEGQFAACFRKEGEGEARIGAFSRPLQPDGRRMLRQIFPEELPDLHQIGRMIISQPVLPRTDGLRVLRQGLRIAEMRENYLIPDHALAMSGWKLSVGVREMDETETVRYLSGETMEGVGSGWMLARYRGLNLGWGKTSQGIFKNHYPKGLRKTVLRP